jgi:hypothetical protein
MVSTDTIEGTVDRSLWFHYDVVGDVLYIRLDEHRDSPTFSEETEEGLLLLRHAETDEPVGLTVVNWWSRFGHGRAPDSLRKLERRIEPWARKLAA